MTTTQTDERHDAAVEWLSEQVEAGNLGYEGFYADLLRKVGRYGALTPGQVDAVHRAIAELLRKHGIADDITLDTGEDASGFTVDGSAPWPIIISRAYDYMPSLAADFEQTVAAAMPTATVTFEWTYADGE